MRKEPKRWIRDRADWYRERIARAPSWQRTLIIVWIAEFVSLAGFSMVMPFLPFYVEDLGVTDPNQVKFWSGIILSAHAVTMAVFAPIWGSMADRYGRKVMLNRAIFGASIVLTLMAFAQNPQQLLVMRLLQGCLTGTVPAATTLVASMVPRERTGFALGWLQMGIFGGVSIGPLIGGVIADTFNYRTSFLLTGAILFVSGLGVLVFVHEKFEPPQYAAGQKGPHWWEGLAVVIRSRELVTVLGARLLTRLGARVIGPILPLFVATLLPESARVATMAGIVTGASSAASSIGAVILGRTGDRIGYRRILLVSAAASALFYALQAAVSNITQLIILQFLVGIALAGSISSLEALLATLAPEGRQGAVFGISTTVISGANAVGPMMGASLAMITGDRSTFLLAAGVFVVSTILIAWLLPARRPVSELAEELESTTSDYTAKPAKST
jgi:DHA1 family multidrug resistance protein-like MFS transporter